MACNFSYKLSRALSLGLLLGFSCVAADASIIVEVGQPGNLVDVTEQGQMFVDEVTGTQFWQSEGDLEMPEEWLIPESAGGLSVSSNPDPFISTGFTFINLTGGTADFVVSVSNFSADEIPTPIIHGETNYDLTDANNSGSATLDQESGKTEALYNAFFGGDGDVRDLLPPGDALPIGAAGVVIGNIGGEYSDEAAGAGLSVGEEFGIRHEFSLTAFDRLTVQSTFVIVPEPSTIALLGLAAFGFAAVRHR